MNRADLQTLSRIRRRESSALMAAGCYPGAYYLVGYAVECALKACIAKATKRHDFPNKQIATQVYTHDLQALVRLAGLKPGFDADRRASPSLDLNWAVVKDWSEESRYDLGISRSQARDLYSACTTRIGGILPWIRQRW